VAFLQENAITKGILDDLERRLPEAEKHAEEIVATEKNTCGDDGTEHVAISYWVLKKCLASGQTDYAMQIGNRFGGEACRAILNHSEKTILNLCLII